MCLVEGIAQDFAAEIQCADLYFHFFVVMSEFHGCILIATRDYGALFTLGQDDVAVFADDLVGSGRKVLSRCEETKDGLARRAGCRGACQRCKEAKRKETPKLRSVP